MLSFLIGCGIGYLAYEAALVVTGYFLVRTETLEELVTNMLRWVYAMSAAVFGSWALFGPMSEFMIVFAIAHAVSLCLIDLEATFENN